MTKDNAMAGRAGLEAGGVCEHALRLFPSLYDNKDAVAALNWLETQMVEEAIGEEETREKLITEAQEEQARETISEIKWKVDASNLPRGHYASDLAQVCREIAAILPTYKAELKGHKVKATKEQLLAMLFDVHESADMLLDALATALEVDQKKGGWGCSHAD